MLFPATVRNEFVATDIQSHGRSCIEAKADRRKAVSGTIQNEYPNLAIDPELQISTPQIGDEGFECDKS